MSPRPQSFEVKSIMQRKSRRYRAFGMGRNAPAILLAVTAVFVGACGAARPTKYYQLTPLTESIAAKASDPLPVTLLVGPLKASHLYREDRIVYGTKGEEMGTYEYQRWAEPPTEMLQEMLVQELRSSGHYRSVYPLSSDAHGDYILRGRLFNFREISQPLSARVTLEVELREVKSGSIVWSHSYTHDEPVSGKDVPGVVAALDRNAQRAVSEIRAGLDEYLASPQAK